MNLYIQDVIEREKRYEQIILLIKGLNTKDFEDYKRLAIILNQDCAELRKDFEEAEVVYNHFKSNPEEQVTSEENFGFKGVSNTLNMISEINKVSYEFAVNFFLNDELIRHLDLQGEELKSFCLLHLPSFALYPMIDYSTMEYPGLYFHKQGFNQHIISEISRKINSGYFSRPKPTPAESDDCFIASYAYQSAYHPDVCDLRLFRDNTLRNSGLGRWFIKYYYVWSPGLVGVFSYLRIPPRIIRFWLIRFVLISRRMMRQ